MEDVRNIADGYNASGELLRGRTVTTNVTTCESFHSYFQDLLRRVYSLMSTQFGTFSADFSRLEEEKSVHVSIDSSIIYI